MGNGCWVGNQYYSLFQDTKTICKWDYKAEIFEIIRRERNIPNWKEVDHKQQTNDLDINLSSKLSIGYEMLQTIDQIIYLSLYQLCKHHELFLCQPQNFHSSHPFILDLLPKSKHFFLTIIFNLLHHSFSWFFN